MIYNTIDSNIYRTAYWGNTFNKITSGGSVSSYGSNSNPRNLDFDSSGNVYFCHNGSGSISKFNGSSISTWVSIASVSGVARIIMNSARDYLYVLTKSGVYGLYKIKVSDGTTTQIKTFSNEPTWFDFGRVDGEYYITFYGTGDLVRLNTDNSLTTLENKSSIYYVKHLNKKVYFTIRANTADGKHIWYYDDNTFNPAIPRRKLLML